eukprot:jgi/Picsp_1/2121/NSC_05586-R1_thiamine-phosphate pyrophosphorylase
MLGSKCKAYHNYLPRAKRFVACYQVLRSKHGSCQPRYKDDLILSQRLRLREMRNWNHGSSICKRFECFSSRTVFSDTKSNVKTLLVVDFDGTCSKEDTTCKIVDSAIRDLVSNISDPVEKEAESSRREALYGELLDSYVNRLESILNRNTKQVNSVGVKGTTWLLGFLDELTKFDHEMKDIVVQSGLLEGIIHGSLKHEGETIEMHENCVATLQKALKLNAVVAVVSVNWSAEMLASALESRGLPVVIITDPVNSPLELNKINVFANELDYNNERSTGFIKSRCVGANDKMHALVGLKANVEAAIGQMPISIYIGDSITDAYALLRADVGINFGQEENLTRILGLGAIDSCRITQLADLPPRGVQHHSDSGMSSIVYHSNDWKEIGDTFLRLLAVDKPADESCPTNGAMCPPRVMFISGSDSGGGAGMQADLNVCNAVGAFGSSVLTAVTAQNTFGVNDVQNLDKELIIKQIRAVHSDIGADAIKIGMLSNEDIVEVISKEIKRMVEIPPIVLDPVMVATSGDSLASAGVCKAMIKHLLPLVTLITPNLMEASIFLDKFEISSKQDMIEAAKRIHGMGPRNVLVKGGHMKGTSIAVDILFDGDHVFEVSKPYIDATNSHGTGCSLSSYIACEIAKGAGVSEAVDAAKCFIWRAIERSQGLSIGNGPQKPMNLNFETNNWNKFLDVSKKRLPNAVDLSLYSVTSPSMCLDQTSEAEVIAKIGQAVLGGAKVVQIRDKKSSSSRSLRLVKKVVEICRPRGVCVIVNDRVDIAIAADACGCHVGQDDIPAASVRKMLGEKRILGVSVKTEQQAKQAEADGADYVGAGATFSTGTKSSSIIGIEGVKKIRQAISIPVVAIGGLTQTNIENVITETGCAGVAMVSAIYDVEDPYVSTKRLHAIIKGCYTIN